MLFVLSGSIQIGKSRWLERLTVELDEAGIVCVGVLAPGVWVESSSGRADARGFEKLGIDSVLLPQRTRVRFADRIDLAQQAGTYDAQSQAGRAALGWHISDAAIDEVNAHLASLRSLCADDPASRCLLIVDELGRLELEHDAGLVEAVRLLEEGSRGGTWDALVVARDAFAAVAVERFGAAWGGVTMLEPSERSRKLLVEHLVRGA